MKLLTVLLIHLLVLAAACPSYEQYLNFYSNYTESTNQTVEPRWTDAVTPASSRRKRWPRDNNSKFTTISYCYVDVNSWTNLQKPFTAAVKKWTDKLEPPGSDTHHALRILEVSGDGLIEQPFCFLEKDGQPVLPPTWNPKIDEGALAIVLSLKGGNGAAATMGYREPGPTAPKPRNKIMINIGGQDPDPWSDAPADVRVVQYLTHELGMCSKCNFYDLHSINNPSQGTYLAWLMSINAAIATNMLMLTANPCKATPRSRKLLRTNQSRVEEVKVIQSRKSVRIQF